MTTKITFDKDGNETIASVQRRVAELTGFQYKRIVLMEGNLTGGVYDSISFQVNGRGYSTDFEDFDRNPVFDEPRPYEVNYRRDPDGPTSLNIVYSNNRAMVEDNYSRCDWSLISEIDEARVESIKESKPGIPVIHL